MSTKGTLIVITLLFAFSNAEIYETCLQSYEYDGKCCDGIANFTKIDGVS